MEKSSNQRVAVFVDVQNLFYSARNLMNAKVDYSKLLDGVVAGRQLIRSIAYVVQRPDVPQDKFLDALSRIGYEIRVKEAKNKTDGEGKTIPTKGSYEVMFAIDAVEICEKVDVVVLITGDGQYAPLARYLHSRGVKVEVVGFDKSTSRDLIAFSDKHLKIRPDWTFEANQKEPDPVEESHGNTLEEELPEDDGPQPASYASKFGALA
jgi:uncharacterized LabA/DUF88 family protein